MSAPAPKPKRKKATTIVDIAQHAGVAAMTVSRVINQSGPVSASARERVQRAIEELDYHPNAIARSLKSRSSKVIGILLPDVANPFSAELARGIQEILQASGYTTFLATSQRSVEQECDSLRAFYDHRVDGVIVATRETAIGNAALERYAERGLAVVAVGRHIDHPAMDRVTADHRRGASEAVRHLVGLGHRQIGFLGVTLANGAGLLRFQGYLDGLKEQGLPVDAALIVGPERSGPAYSTQEDGYEGLKALFDAGHRPTAVCCRNDYTAIGAVHAARDLGLGVPDDLSIAGFDNLPISAFTSPPLTTVEQPTVDQGRQAARFLVERLAAGDAVPERREFRFPCRLVIRESTGPRKG